MRNPWPIVFLIAGCVPVHAASFDCTKAKTPQEKAICASPQLSTADDQMAAAYHAWLAAAGPQGSAGVLADQRAWIRYRTAQCAATLSSAQMQSCLATAYHARIGELQQMIQQKAGVSFVWHTITLTAPDGSATNPPGTIEMNPGFGTLQASWPQATAATPEWAAWNQAMEDATRKSAQNSSDSSAAAESQWKAEPDVDSDITVSIDSVGAQLVATSIATFWDGHGAHPDHSSSQFNWILNQKRALQPADVFLPTSNWQNWMQARIDQYLRKTLDNQYTPDYQTFLQPGQAPKVLHEIATDPTRWKLNPQGLTISFQPYEIACYACTPPPITISWTALKPYLQPTFVLPR